MHGRDKKTAFSVLLITLPILSWLVVVNATEPLYSPRYMALMELIELTPSKPHLIGGFVFGLGVAILLVLTLSALLKSEFRGAPFRTFIRGTRIVSARKLYRRTKTREAQISIAGIPMPPKTEPLHVLVNGATGTGKSVLLRELVASALSRGDRMVIVDPNGDMFSKFGTEKDYILNPYDSRTQGWSFFNEIQNEYDFHRYALSIVPRGRTEEAEEWASYGRLLLRETARKLALIGNPCVHALFHWTTIEEPEKLRQFLQGTLAESLFAGSSEASRALSSARFVLSDKLTEHLSMPAGEFSIRQWLTQEDAGNLYITWREDMSVALKPLISAWVDVLCTSVLSLPEEDHRRIWLVIDELATLEKLASLEAALTKGRKHGLRVVAGLQSTSQVDEIYGLKAAQTLRSCFRTLVVLGGSRTDPKTNEDMSQCLGEHEVERVLFTHNQGERTSTTRSIQTVRERVVTPTELAHLPELTAFVALAGNYPITRVLLKIQQYPKIMTAFEGDRAC
jgi:type IV secretory pathway TraG/TraD family ATPase VirD4